MIEERHDPKNEPIEFQIHARQAANQLVHRDADTSQKMIEARHDSEKGPTKFHKHAARW